MRHVILVVMDGWGLNPRKNGNAIEIARTPNLGRFLGKYPSTSLLASGNAVGLPEGQMGNSEVGHLTLGAGRVIFQELTRINRAIEDGSFHKNTILTGVLSRLKQSGAKLHLLGLASDGGVHSHIKHLYAILESAKKAGLEKVYIHAFLDGRDTPPESGRGYVEQLLLNMEKIGVGRIATISGRYYAMDRDRRWDRVKKAYEAVVEGKGVLEQEGPVSAVKKAYMKKETDEFVSPVVMTENGRPVAIVEDGDAVIFFNFRADRARELTMALTDDDFEGWERIMRPNLSNFLTMTEYDARFNLPVLFQPQGLKNILSEVLAENGVRQFRVSETEKYAHVTFFFNGGVEKPYPGEDRLLIPSARDVATYDKKPEMRAREIADKAVEAIGSGNYGFILVNFPNGDMVGHSGILSAAVKACESVDSAVGSVVDAAVKKGWAAMITSDHGNAEQMIDPATNEPHTAHTLNPVPFILADDKSPAMPLKKGRGLSDVAPTVLKIMGIQIPKEMEGTPLF